MSWPSNGALWFVTFGSSRWYWYLCVAVGLPYILVPISYGRVLRYKLRTIESFMSNNAVFAAYVNRFGPANNRAGAAPGLFGLTYDWRVYGLAIFFNLVIIAAAVCVCLIRGGVSMNLPLALEALLATAPVTVLLSLGGAYILNLYDLLKRYRVGDLYPSCLHFHWLHMIVAAFLGPLLAQAFAPGVARVVAFGVGIFPLKDSLDTVKKYAAKRLELSPTRVAAEGASLNKVQGLTQETIERLEEEGINSTEHLAYSDPIKLLLRTNIPWVILIDLIDQALLYNYVGDKITELRSIGIRGAIEMAAIVQDLLKGDEEEKKCARMRIHIVAVRLGLSDDDEGLNLVRSFYEDGQVDLLWELYTPEFPDQVLAANPTEEGRS
jgi:hypothetical protein